MKKMINNINKKHLLLFSLTIFFFFVGFLFEHFAADTYYLEVEGYKANADFYLQAGRVVMYVFLRAMSYLNLTFAQAKIVSLVLAMVSLIIATYTFDLIIIKKIKNDLLSALISILVILNAFLIEYFIFAEFTGVMCFALMTAVVAAKFFLDYVENNKKEFLLFSFMAMLISMLSYQGVASLFVCIVSLLLIEKFKTWKPFFKYNILMGFIYGIPAILSFILTKIFGSTRTSITGNDYFLSFKKIIIGLWNLLISSSNVLPKYFFIILILLIFITIVINILKSQKWILLIYFCYFMFMLVFFTVLPQLMVGTDAIWVVARSNFAIGSIVGFSILFFILYLKPTKKIVNMFLIIMISLISMQYIGYERIKTSNYIVNSLDKQYAMDIIKSIKEYETNSNIKITKITYYNDNNSSYIYDGTIAFGDMNVRAMRIDWSRKYIVSYYAGNKYLDAKDNKIFSNYCEINNWDTYNFNQLLFVNDELYICVY